MGAADVLLNPDSDAGRRASDVGGTGARVLLLGEASTRVDADNAPGDLTPRALIVLAQKVRPDAADTIAYFHDQGVDVKVISGDNARSVGAVAASLGRGDADNAVDARELPSDTDELADTLERGLVFGRVKPDGKRAMVRALHSPDHIVAMTGDGVNDVLALKDADIGVAMGSGSDATRAVAQIVLLDNKFATLPHVVAEGRRVIGNIERVAHLFLTKTIYAVTLALVIAATTLGCYLMLRRLDGFTISHTQVATAALLTLILGSWWVLVIVARPLDRLRVALVAACFVAYIPMFLPPLTRDWFSLDPTHHVAMGIAAAWAAVAIAALEGARHYLPTSGRAAA